LSREKIDRIADAYRRFVDVAGFSRVIDVREVAENDYNLNVTLYVMPVEEREEIDISKEFSELKELEREREGIMKKIEEYVSEIAKAMGS
jgi:type I restriction enzyme M protein